MIRRDPEQEKPPDEEVEFTPFIVLGVILGAFLIGLLILTFSLYFG